jgi:hypothetical protein
MSKITTGFVAAVIAFASCLREITTRLSYCDHRCYLGQCKRAVPALRSRAS